MIEQLLLWNYPRSGLVEVSLFIVILVALLVQRQRAGRDEEKGSWAAVQALRPLPLHLQELPAIRLMGPVLATLGLSLLAVLPLFITNSLSVTFTGMIGFAIVGLSIGVLTGLGGQLTLGQFAVASIGAVISYQVSSRIGEFPLALLYSGLGAGLVSVVIGLPALRIRGLMLTVTTLGFALATPAWLLDSRGCWATDATPASQPGGRSTIRWTPDTATTTSRSSCSCWRSCSPATCGAAGSGGCSIAIRDNEDNARAFTVRASVVKMQGYLLPGFIAGIGGATFGHSLSNLERRRSPSSRASRSS